MDINNYFIMFQRGGLETKTCQSCDRVCRHNHLPALRRDGRRHAAPHPGVEQTGNK